MFSTNWKISFLQENDTEYINPTAGQGSGSEVIFQQIFQQRTISGVSLRSLFCFDIYFLIVFLFVMLNFCICGFCLFCFERERENEVVSLGR